VFETQIDNLRAEALPNMEQQTPTSGQGVELPFSAQTQQQNASGGGGGESSSASVGGGGGSPIASGGGGGSPIASGGGGGSPIASGGGGASPIASAGAGDGSVGMPEFVWDSVMNPILRPLPSKNSKGKINPMLDIIQVTLWLASVLGLQRYDGDSMTEQRCWPCKYTFKKHPGLFGTRPEKKSAGIKVDDPFYQSILTMTNFNKQNSNSENDIDHSPLVKKDKEALFLHCCLWLYPRTCVFCTGDVLCFLFDNFDTIFNSIVDIFRTEGNQECQNAFFYLQKKKFDQGLTARLTGNPTLCRNLIQKKASARFIENCIFIKLGRDVGDLHTLSELIKTPLTKDQKSEKKLKSAEEIETRKDESLKKALLKSDEQKLFIEEKHKRYKKRTLELMDKEEALQKRAGEIEQEKFDLGEKAKAAKFKKGGKGAKTVTHSSGQDALHAQGQGSGGGGSSAGPVSGGAGCSAGQRSGVEGSSQDFEAQLAAFRS